MTIDNDDIVIYLIPFLSHQFTLLLSGQHYNILSRQIHPNIVLGYHAAKTRPNIRNQIRIGTRYHDTELKCTFHESLIYKDISKKI